MRAVATEMVALLERLAAVASLPRVLALHLPPPSADGTRDGEFCAIELEDGSLGLSFVLLGDTLAALRGAPEHAALAGMLAPVDAARRRVGELLLHVRENLEARAQTEGRAAGEVWAEAAEASAPAAADPASQPGGAVTT